MRAQRTRPGEMRRARLWTLLDSRTTDAAPRNAPGTPVRSGLDLGVCSRARGSLGDWRAGAPVERRGRVYRESARRSVDGRAHRL